MCERATLTPVSANENQIQTSHVHPIGFNARSDDDEAPQSVIHAPPGFGDFVSPQGTPSLPTTANYWIKTQTKPPHNIEEQCETDSSSPNSEQEESIRISGKAKKIGLIERLLEPRPDLNLRSQDDGLVQVAWKTLNLTGIFIIRVTDSYLGDFTSKEAEIKVLRDALEECWTLCNTLASLSYINRNRQVLSHDDGMQEGAWRSCWMLCSKLYETREEDFASQVNPLLDLCRDFCQALFEVRIYDGDGMDSVLRVSFELNNHLYNTHDRNLPGAFRERTLDFYVTLCHRLMKQRTRLNETDSLLSACWTLAEILFRIRQSKREREELDQELLEPAVQACWELCDIFRERSLHGMRNPDRGTPRPSQTTFAHAFQQAQQISEVEFIDDSLQFVNPETPTTIFEDTATVSPDEAPIPNILVLGSKWPSTASSVSENSRSSGHTASSANTVTTMADDLDFTRLKVLITKAAINSGYQRGGPQNLSSFVKSLPSDAFGSASWQKSLLKYYRKLVAFDPTFINVGPQARVSAIDVARVCQSMLQSGQYSWLRDLYRLVFGFHMEEALGRKGVTIQT
ncbi:hypothetical protein N7495_007176 [Penicillium taxi]|uniref:uncharacterized protein n=1 Tax=Penicillium taxi TaxID=168475 RepID=UPI0025456E81|nr:uncharacterized protein N7495_007176 [Penicillium taxi]KAJ5895485.1 hypothetical protein N7495_007176 [Penicillium taxi]